MTLTLGLASRTLALWEKVFYPSPMHAHSSSLVRDDASLEPATPTQYTLNQCKDKITVCRGVGRIFTQVQCLKFTRSHFSVNAKNEKRAVSMCKLMFVFNLLIFTSRFVDRPHARLFVEIYIRACDKLTFFTSAYR